MAALVLSIAGAAAGSSVLGPIGAIVGRLVGAVAGNVIDQALFGACRNVSLEGPRLTNLTVMASTEGAAVPRFYALLNVRFGSFAAEPFSASTAHVRYTSNSDHSRHESELVQCAGDGHPQNGIARSMPSRPSSVLPEMRDWSIAVKQLILAVLKLKQGNSAHR
jgi:hypothetical protein